MICLTAKFHRREHENAEVAQSLSAKLFLLPFPPVCILCELRTSVFSVLKILAPWRLPAGRQG
jgi:hypothetical protein